MVIRSVPGFVATCCLGIGCALLSASASPSATAAEPTASGLKVEPAVVELTDTFARRQLLVWQNGRDVTRRAKYTSSSGEIVSVDENGFVVPRQNGAGTLQITVGDQSLAVPVQVTGQELVRPVDFATEVQPLLNRFGCNSGGCHGKASGQNGFKLSLFGFDTAFDYAALVHEARGRRVFSSAPERSLLLTKAAGEVPHGGGRRIAPGSEPYRLLLAWLQAGAPASSADVRHVAKLSVTPAEILLQPDDQQQLAVLAHYSDGSTRDVTRDADYGSNLDVVATVNPQGLITANPPTGEAAVMIRYMGQVAVATVIRPQGTALAAIDGWTSNNFIDELAAEKWKKLGLRPSPVADDATFLRRLTIDLCGRLPTVDEVREFLADSRADKRALWIDRLLKSPDYAAYFAMKWGSILRNSNLAGADRTAYAFHNWIKEMLARNRPYDEFVRGIVAASGEWQDAPAINWFWQSRDDQLHQVTADTAQVFLGLRLQCAKCHHHPYERFSQDDYYGLAGFYIRLGRKSFGEPPPYYSSPNVMIGEVHPLTGKGLEPKYLDGPVAKFGPDEDPRQALVDWMARPENPFFAKALVNRMWGHFFGRGIVHEVDDLRETNPPSNPELLARLSQEFIQQRFDVQHILRLMLNSRVYQLSSIPTDANASDAQNFARYYPKRFPAEVMLDAVDQACGSKSSFGNMSADARAVDLPHENFGSYFLDAFDRPRRVTSCECERSTGATLSQVLLLANSDELEGKIAYNGRVQRMFEAQRSTPQMIEELYLATFSRYPSPVELIAAERHVATDPQPRRGIEDVLWSLVNSREFVFNH
jgi:hypothetical protein